MRVLESIKIQNFKSIREQELRLAQLNVFIGANGSGKSNLIQAFRLLREINQQNIKTYSLQRGVDSLLYFGRKTSPFMKFELSFDREIRCDTYEIHLVPTDDGALAVSQHHVSMTGAVTNSMTNGSTQEVAYGGDPIANAIDDELKRVLAGFHLYHFHDTSDTALVKGAGLVDDNRFLRPDASNLAAFLYLLQQTKPDHFRNIEDALRQIAPFFDRFNLEPSRLSPDKIRLEWKEKGSDAYFNAASLSDGTLRFMCLATLLLQPDLPPLILLDEPELGLHPAAVALLADLLSSAAARTQVLVATQSVTLVNQFEPEQVWTVDRADGQSVFRHLATQDLSAWLDAYGGCEGYGLGELWEKNILGARP